VLTIELSARRASRIVALASAVETRSKVFTFPSSKAKALTFVDFNGLGEVINIHHKHPFVLGIERLLREDHFLSAAAKLVFVDVELPGVDLSLLALTVENVVEQPTRNLWLLQKLLENPLGWIIPRSVAESGRTGLGLPFCSPLIKPGRRTQ